MEKLAGRHLIGCRAAGIIARRAAAGFQKSKFNEEN